MSNRRGHSLVQFALEPPLSFLPSLLSLIESRLEFHLIKKIKEKLHLSSANLTKHITLQPTFFLSLAAGKTESQKYVLRYLCLSGSQSGRLEKLILDANPLLEAFGNAKTIRNNNSSRFGKFIEIHYSHKFQVTGGLFFHYLLEKSRICTQSAGERNYHIFYQLCACLPKDQWERLHLKAPDHFRYLASGCTQYFCSQSSDSQLGSERKSQVHKQNGAIQDQLTDDLECYRQTDRALSNFGVSEEQKQEIYSIVAAVLHLGNISFVEDQDDKSGGCNVEPGQAEQSVQLTADLMGLDVELLRQSLTTRVMSTARGGHKGTVYMVQLNVHQAQAARDALAKAIYSKLFDYIVTKIVNKSIPFSSSAYYIGVLDVAGFEYFQHNSFEQFLINFCNERLQQFFNERILKEEQSIYEKEGLNLERVEFVDNQDCIQLFESKGTGIFDLLDEESRLPKPSALHFTQSVHDKNKSHFRLALPRHSKLKWHREIRDDEGFLIRHFAGAVCYETNSFIDKNNDALHASLKNLMLDARHKMLRNLFSDRNSSQASATNQSAQGSQALQNMFTQQSYTSGGGSTNKLAFVSVGTTFRSQLNELMAKLRSTGSHFIRCIKPNSEMVAHKFEGGQILSQLHCSGMDSVLQLMQKGFPSRSSFNDLYQSYKRYLPQELARLDSHMFCRALFKALGLSDKDFRFGSSKVFFRPGKFAEFDQIVRSDGDHVAELVKRVSKWLICSRWRKAQYCCLSVIKLNRKILYRRALIVRLQKNWRAAIVGNKLKFRLVAIKSARKIGASVAEFEQIVGEQLKKLPEKNLLDQQAHLLRQEIDAFVAKLTAEVQSLIDESNNNNGASESATIIPLVEAKAHCQSQLDVLATKRDLLVRSIRDKIAKLKELQDLERKMAEEKRKREEEELTKRREADMKAQRSQLELRRQEELKVESAGSRQEFAERKLVDTATDPMSLHALTSNIEDQEQRDYEIALRLAQESGGQVDRSQHLNQSQASRKPLAPSENHAQDRKIESKFDLTKWKYSDLRDTINTSCNLELLEACKREFHRRLKVYHAWRAMNSRQVQGSETTLSSRAPISVMEGGKCSPLEMNEAECLRSAGKTINEQRYFRIPFVRSSPSGQQHRGWWFAHFDGQWIARQLELHPDRDPILLIAGQHDIEMCELSLRETRLTSKRGAEILPQEFEEEWAKHGGKPFARTGGISTIR